MNSENNITDVIGVISVNYKTPELVITLLHSLSQERLSIPNIHVAIIDNASGDDSGVLIQKAITDNDWTDWVKLILAPKNGGYAYGNNLGFSTLESWLPAIDYYWMLNPDTEALPGSTAALVQHLKEQPNTIAGSCLQDRDGTKQCSTFNFPSAITEMCSSFGLGVLDKIFADNIICVPIPEDRSACDWLAGASLMFNKNVKDNIGGLDETYFLYFEEVDYLLNANRVGVQCWYVPESRIIHEVGASTGISDSRKKQKRRPAYWFESRRRYFIKNHGRFYTMLCDFLWLKGYALWYIRKFITHREEVDIQPPMLWLDFARYSQLNPINWFVTIKR